MKIRGKVILSACVLVALFTGVFLLSHLLFLRSFYIYRNREPFRTVYQAIGQYQESSDTDILGSLRALGSETGYKLSIVNAKGDVEYSSSPEFDIQTGARIPIDMEAHLVEWIAQKQESEPFYGIVERRGDLSELVFMGALNPGRYFVASLPLKQLDTNADIALTFSLFTGAILLLLTIVLIALLSDRAIEPVREITRISASIAALDFSRRYTGSTNDEFETLGRNINRISVNLSAAMETLEKDVILQRRFLAGLAHELKSPLGLIRGYAEVIQIGKATSEVQAREFSGIIIEEADRLDRMVRDMLLIGEIEGNGFHLRSEPIDIAQVITESIHVFDSPSGRIRKSIPQHLTVSCDPDRIRQILDNLLSNAIRHGRADGDVEVRCSQSDGLVLIEVSNKGPMIPDEHIPHLFNTFYRAEDSRNRSEGGVGLGLSIAKGLVEAHGGTIGVENHAGGPTFWFSIPVSP
jgi:two-component system, OmpR family, sensor histidine kinase VanS